MVEGVEQGAPDKQKKHHASHQSESNISVASTNRGEDGEENEIRQYGFGTAKTHPQELTKPSHGSDDRDGGG